MPSTIDVVENKSLKTQYLVIYVPVEAMEVDPAAVKGNPRTLLTMSPSRPDPVLNPDHALSQSAREQGWQPTRCHLVPTVVPVLASQVVFTDLAGPMLAKPVSQQSVAGAAQYLMRQAGTGAATVHSAVCHHDPDRLQPGQLATGVMASWPHPRLPVSTVPTPHRRHVPTGPAAARAGLAARPRQEGFLYCPTCSTASKRLPAPSWPAPRSLLLSLSKLVDVKTSLGPCPVGNLLVSSKPLAC